MSRLQLNRGWVLQSGWWEITATRTCQLSARRYIQVHQKIARNPLQMYQRIRVNGEKTCHRSRALLKLACLLGSSFPIRKEDEVGVVSLQHVCEAAAYFLKIHPTRIQSSGQKKTYLHHTLGIQLSNFFIVQMSWWHEIDFMLTIIPVVIKKEVNVKFRNKANVRHEYWQWNSCFITNVWNNTDIE